MAALDQARSAVGGDGLELADARGGGGAAGRRGPGAPGEHRRRPLARRGVGRGWPQVGANALRSHGARPLAVLVRQLRNPLLILLVAAALTSFAVGERTERADHPR